MSLHTYNLRNGAPQEIDTKKLPPGHAMFHGGNLLGMYVCWGIPYDLGGKRLQSDVSWLRENGYYVGEEVIKQLRIQQLQNPTLAPKKQCIECAAEIRESDRFCPTCGAPQVKKTDLWTPGSGGEGDSIAKLIDPEDPLGSLEAIQGAETTQVKRETPDEIFQRLSKDEAAKTLRDAGSALPADADLSATKLETSEFGRIKK